VNFWSGASWQSTFIAVPWTLPKMLATAASEASRPPPMRTKPFSGVSRVASKISQRPPM